jgi:hypothetical protein
VRASTHLSSEYHAETGEVPESPGDAASRPSRAATALRYCGLLGALLLALAAARSGQRAIALPTWFAGTVVLTGAWLLLGRRLTGVRLPWLLVTGALWALPVLVSLPLESRDVYAYACQGSLVTHGIDPYTHGAASLPCPWLSDVPRLWRHTPSPYGPLWLAVSGAAAASRRLVVAVALFRLVALAGVALAAWAGHRLARAVGVDPVRAAWLALLSPLVLVHGLSGAHNDALLAGLVVAAFAVAARSRPGALLRTLAVGALFGLAVAVKASALVAVPFAVLLLAADRRWWSVIRAGAVTGLGLIGAYGTLWALTGYGLGWVPALSNTTRLIVEATSIPTGLGSGAARLLRNLGQPALASHAISGFRALGLLVLAAVLVGLWFRARRRTDPRAVVLAGGVALLASVVLAPVAFPWYALAGLVVLAYGGLDDRWRYRLALLVAPVGLLILPNGNGLAAVFKGTAALLDGLLVLVAAALTARHLRRRRTPAGTP